MDRCIEINQLRKAFTLLEVTLSLALGLVLVTAIFSVATSTIQMTSEISDFQASATRQQAFISLCRKTLLQLEAGGRIGLLTNGEAGNNRLIIDGDPGAFSFGSVSQGSSRMVMFSTPTTGGEGKTIFVKYLNADEAEGMDEGEWNDIGIDLKLIDGVSQCQWAFFDKEEMAWVGEWALDKGRPSLIELRLGTERSDSRQVFWVPTFVAPELDALPVLPSGTEPGESTAPN